MSTWSALTTTAPHAIITMLGTIRFVLVNIFISCELIYVADDYNACPFLLINLSGAKTVFAAIANSSATYYMHTLHKKIYHTVNRLRSFLSLGHSVTWSLGHSVTRSLGHSVTWSLGHPVTWSPSHLVIPLSCHFNMPTD